MSLYYNESPFVDGKTDLDQAHFNPMSEAISFSCAQVVEEGAPIDENLFGMVSAGANVLSSFVTNENQTITNVYSNYTEYSQDDEYIIFSYLYMKNTGTGTFTYRTIKVSRNGVWGAPIEIDYTLPIKQ